MKPKRRKVKVEVASRPMTTRAQSSKVKKKKSASGKKKASRRNPANKGQKGRSRGKRQSLAVALTDDKAQSQPIVEDEGESQAIVEDEGQSQAIVEDEGQSQAIVEDEGQSQALAEGQAQSQARAEVQVGSQASHAIVESQAVAIVEVPIKREPGPSRPPPATPTPRPFSLADEIRPLVAEENDALAKENEVLRKIIETLHMAMGNVVPTMAAAYEAERQKNQALQELTTSTTKATIQTLCETDQAVLGNAVRKFLTQQDVLRVGTGNELPGEDKYDAEPDAA